MRCINISMVIQRAIKAHSQEPEGGPPCHGINSLGATEGPEVEVARGGKHKKTDKLDI